MKLMHYLVLTLCAHLLVATEQTYPLLNSMQIGAHKVSYEFHEHLRRRYLKNKRFWIEYDDSVPIKTMPYEIQTAPAILNCATLVWHSGKIFTIDSMDKHLYESLQQLKLHCKTIYPETSWEGEIRPLKLVDCAQEYASLHSAATTKGLLFSCGLDATASFFAHLDEPLQLITVHGHPDIPHDQREEFNGLFERIQGLAGYYGKESTAFRSNHHAMLNTSVVNKMVDGIDDWRFYTMESLSWLGLTLPILISKGCSTLYMGGTSNWEYNERTMTNPLTDGCLNCAGFTIEQDLFEKTRYEKTALIVDAVRARNLPRPFIKACHVLPNAQCGSCWKCCPLMATLLALGEDIEEYGFDCSPQQVAERLVKHCSKKVVQWDAYNLKDLQKRLTKDFSQQRLLYRLFEPFLSFDMSRLVVYSGMDKPVNWSELYALTPAVDPPHVAPYFAYKQPDV